MPALPSFWAGRVALAGLLAGLAACGALPPRGEPAAAVNIPAGWSVQDAAGAGATGVGPASLVAWWRRFDDAQLTRLVEAALGANTRIAAARAALQQAQALRQVAVAGLGPTVGSSASAQRGLAGGHSTGNSLQLGLDGNWPLDMFGARRAALDAAEASLAASAASLGDVQVQIAGEVGLNYILLRSLQLRAAIARGTLAAQQETLQITLWRQQAGLLTELEAEQARTAVLQNQAQLTALEASALPTQHALAVLIGLPPAALPGLAVQPAADTPFPWAGAAVALAIPAQALRQRADVVAAEYTVAAALARVGQAQAQRWPSFAIGGSLGLSAATLGGLGGSGALLASLLASVSLPVFDGGALRAQVQVQQAELAQAEQAYRAAVLGALQQVEDALAALRGDQQRLASLRQAADAATQAAALARQRYSSGLVDFQTVLDTQRSQYATLDGVASASADVGSDQVRLFKALGGGWQAAPTTAKP